MWLSGGHVDIGDGAIIGGAAALRQFVRIGRAAMIGGVSGVERDVVPFGTVMGNRAWLAGLNIVGLRRRGVDKTQLHTIRSAFNQLFGGVGVFAERFELVSGKYGDDPYIAEILAFARTPSKMGLIRSVLSREEEG